MTGVSSRYAKSGLKLASYEFLNSGWLAPDKPDSEPRAIQDASSYDFHSPSGQPSLRLDAVNPKPQTLGHRGIGIVAGLSRRL